MPILEICVQDSIAFKGLNQYSLIENRMHIWPAQNKMYLSLSVQCTNVTINKSLINMQSCQTLQLIIAVFCFF